MFFIHQAMLESILPRIETKTNAKEAWDTLETAYQGLDKVKTSKLQILRRDVESLSIKDLENVDTFYTRVVGLINQLKSHGEPIPYQRVVENLFVTLEEHTNMSTFTIDELQDSLINHEHRLSKSQTSLEGAFASQSSIIHGRGRGRNNFRGRGRSSSRGGQGRSPANVGCRGDN